MALHEWEHLQTPAVKITPALDRLENKQQSHRAQDEMQSHEQVQPHTKRIGAAQHCRVSPEVCHPARQLVWYFGLA